MLAASTPVVGGYSSQTIFLPVPSHYGVSCQIHLERKATRSM
eukprot:COSAG02_NODE_393_length_23190_cov_56.721926_9_plen_42_part_00